MCGLSGSAGDCTYQEEKVVKDLLVLNQIRGEDSTGVASVSRHFGGDNRELFQVSKIAKETGPPYFLFDTGRFNQVFQGTNSVYIGHNRSRTVGEVSQRNAHPFRFENVIGAHNGTIDYQNKNRLEGGHAFKTDSEAIFNNIEVHGAEDTIKRLDSSAAYALTWYDHRDRTINLIRNDKRPLFYCYTKEGRTIFWGSEYELLMAALYRNGMKPVKNVHELTPNFLYSWKIPTNSTEKMGDPKRAKLENYKWTYISHDKKKQGTWPEAGGTNGSKITAPRYSHDRRSSESTEEDFNHPDIVENGVPMTWGGFYLGYVPKVKMEEAKAIGLDKGNTGGAIEALKKFFSNSTTTTVITPTRVMTGDDILRKKALERAVKGFEEKLPKEGDTNYAKKHDGGNLKVWRHLQNGTWIALRYQSMRDEWELHETNVPPFDLPYEMLDIRARHEFKHTGKRENKKIYYRGWEKALLDRERFEKVMEGGCVNCARTPEWGNKVVFVSPHHEFLCEHCALDTKIMQDLIDLNKHQKAA